MGIEDLPGMGGPSPLPEADSNEARKIAEIAVERAKLPGIKRKFVAQTGHWLPGWYRECAYNSYAMVNLTVGARLGQDGLRQFRLEVETLMAEADDIVSYHLADDVWWHADEALTRAAVVYSVRLCMGRLRVPLSRYGYIGERDWREAVKTILSRPFQLSDATIEWKEVTEFYEVPTGRPFFRCDKDDEKGRSVAHWSEEMRATLDEYFAVVESVRCLEGSVAKRRKYDETQRIKEVVQVALDLPSEQRSTAFRQPLRALVCDACHAETASRYAECRLCNAPFPKTLLLCTQCGLENESSNYTCDRCNAALDQSSRVYDDQNLSVNG